VTEAAPIVGPLWWALWLVTCFLWWIVIYEVFAHSTMPVVRVLWVIPLLALSAGVFAMPPLRQLWSISPGLTLLAFGVGFTITTVRLLWGWAFAFARPLAESHGGGLLGAIQQLAARRALVDEAWHNGHRLPSAEAVRRLAAWNPNAVYGQAPKAQIEVAFHGPECPVPGCWCRGGDR
jgi:hypothetical protein